MNPGENVKPGPVPMSMGDSFLGTGEQKEQKSQPETKVAPQNISVPAAMGDSFFQTREKKENQAGDVNLATKGKEETAMLGSHPASPTSASVVPNKFSRYEIVQELGRGGMGRVYKAYDPQLDRMIALKLILTGGTAGREEVERFMREARATAKLQHANIVSIYDIGEEQGQVFFTMELVEGQSLKAISKKQKLPLNRIVTLMIKVGSAIHHAHTQGVVHRDLKPANVMIGKNGEPKVMDFGLAKLSKESHQLSHPGMILGTLQYMPPEQAEGKIDQIDAKSDVYALGAMMYEILTQTPPFTGDTTFNLLFNILHAKPENPSKIDPAIPQELSAICLKALSKKKEDRHLDALAFVKELAQFLSKQTGRDADIPSTPAPATSSGELSGPSQVKTIGKPLKIGAAVGLFLAIGAAMAFFYPGQTDPKNHSGYKKSREQEAQDAYRKTQKELASQPKIRNWQRLFLLSKDYSDTKVIFLIKEEMHKLEKNIQTELENASRQIEKILQTRELDRLDSISTDSAKQVLQETSWKGSAVYGAAESFVKLHERAMVERDYEKQAQKRYRDIVASQGKKNLEEKWKEWESFLAHYQKTGEAKKAKEHQEKLETETIAQLEQTSDKMAGMNLAELEGVEISGTSVSRQRAIWQELSKKSNPLGRSIKKMLTAYDKARESRTFHQEKVRKEKEKMTQAWEKLAKKELPDLLAKRAYRNALKEIEGMGKIVSDSLSRQDEGEAMAIQETLCAIRKDIEAIAELYKLAGKNLEKVKRSGKKVWITASLYGTIEKITPLGIVIQDYKKGTCRVRWEEIKAKKLAEFLPKEELKKEEAYYLAMLFLMENDKRSYDHYISLVSQDTKLAEKPLFGGIMGDMAREARKKEGEEKERVAEEKRKKEEEKRKQEREERERLKGMVYLEGKHYPNLFRYPFHKLNKNGFPEGYAIEKATEMNKVSDTVRYIPERENEPAAIQIVLPKTQMLLFRSGSFSIDRNKEYLFTVEIKLEKIQLSGGYCSLYLYGIDDHNINVPIQNSGSTPGWVRVMIPFSAASNPRLEKLRFFLDCVKLSGTVWCRNPALVERPMGPSPKIYFLLEDNTRVEDRFKILK